MPPSKFRKSGKNQRWRPLTGSKYEIPVSHAACVHDINEILMSTQCLCVQKHDGIRVETVYYTSNLTIKFDDHKSTGELENALSELPDKIARVILDDYGIPQYDGTTVRTV